MQTYAANTSTIATAAMGDRNTNVRNNNTLRIGVDILFRISICISVANKP
jgi:hypothetical protein